METIIAIGIEETQIIEKSRSGDVEAFGKLYEIHAPTIFRYIYSRVGNRLDAEDLTEEVFIRVWENMPKFKQRGAPFISYLIRVAHNIVIDHYRCARREGVELTTTEEDIADHRSDAAEVVMENVELNEIRTMLSRLNENYRTVLGLRFFSNLTLEETAYAMRKSPEAVRVLQHRALAALRKLVAES
jgi:RNA polymerase sigma-70 factor (ECF subfamily)